MAHPVGKITQSSPWGAHTGRRYGSFFKPGANTATTELSLAGRAILSLGALLVATTELACTGAARLSARGTAQNVTPKS
jgi:hypothetical protein